MPQEIKRADAATSRAERKGGAEIAPGADSDPSQEAHLDLASKLGRTSNRADHPYKVMQADPKSGETSVSEQKQNKSIPRKQRINCLLHQ